LKSHSIDIGADAMEFQVWDHKRTKENQIMNSAVAMSAYVSSNMAQLPVPKICIRMPFSLLRILWVQMHANIHRNWVYMIIKHKWCEFH